MTKLTRRRTLRLHEQVLLIALRNEDGKIDSKASFEYQMIMAAAMLAELTLLKKVAISNDKKAHVELLDDSSTGNTVLDAALFTIKNSKKRKASDWASKLANMKDLRKETAENLCDKSVLKAKEGTVFFFFDKTYYPELDPKPERELINKLREAIFTETPDVDERTLILLALLYKSSMLEIPFDKKELKARKTRMEKLCSGDLIAQAARQAVEAAKMAIMLTTVILPAVTVTTS